MPRILYVDIDSLRPDHLGCYGYHRPTSPTIDALAAEGTRFTEVYTSDSPCLPSRTALFSGRVGFHTGVVGHGGTGAQPFIEGPMRGFTDLFRETSWPTHLRRAGLRTVTVSAFADRHAAFHWYSGFDEIYNPAPGRLEIADDVNAYAIPWLERNAARDDWFLHVNYWDPHTPYRTPPRFGNPFERSPLPDWYTEEMRQESWNLYGPHSAQDGPVPLTSMTAVRRWIDGYDTGIRYADHALARLLQVLDRAGVLDETAIIISADHGEQQGELSVWGDHHAADLLTTQVPLIVRWPGVVPAGHVDHALHLHIDLAATVLDLLRHPIPAIWDATSFAPALRERTEGGRASLVLSHGAWTVTRSVRWDRSLLMRVYHDGYLPLEPVMLFDVADVHEEHNLAPERPDLVELGMATLARWEQEMLAASPHAVDPLMNVLEEGGPFHVRGTLPRYLRHLRETGRGWAAERLESIHPEEARTDQSTKT